MPKVILDAGHGGSDIGEYYMRRSEKNDNLLLTLRIGQFLMDRGIDVSYTRTSDVYLPMMERVSFVNKNGADLLLSIHRHSDNSFNSTPGLDFYVKEESELVNKVANSIGQGLNSSGYKEFRIIVRTDIPLINETTMPSIMVEIGYIRSGRENTYYDDHLVQIAEGIAEGIHQALISTEAEVGASDFSGLKYRYCVGVGPYSDYHRAFDNQLILYNLGYETNLLMSGDHYYILTTSLVELDDAVVIELQLRRCGFHSFVIIN